MKDKGVVDNTASAEEYKVDDDGTADDNTDIIETVDTTVTVTGAITDIKTSVNDGNTVYYLQVNGKYYFIKVTDCMDVLLLQVGDNVEITVEKESDDSFIEATSVKKA